MPFMKMKPLVLHEDVILSLFFNPFSVTRLSVSEKDVLSVQSSIAAGETGRRLELRWAN